MKNPQRQELILLSIILIVAFALRAYRYFEVPYTHDELSALFRTGYWNLAELIEKGVIMDGHPAGVQVFMNYYILLFGTAEWVVKLPFLLFGLASVYLIYKIGKLCFGETAGAVSAIFLATLQFTVMYSQIARPYISGMFFVLLMTHFWLKYFFSPERNNRYLAGFVVAGILCCYNHYFSMLSAVIIGVTGIFFISRKTIIPYLSSGVAIFIAFLPHLGIFFSHLGNEGLGWLGKPSKEFILDYLGFIFHFSYFSYILVFGLLAFSLYIFFSKKREGNIIRIVFLVWSLLPLLIGYIYSINFMPVLQFSVLIFSFPFLLLFLFSFFPGRTFRTNMVLIGIIALVNIYTLVFERQYYKTFYDMQPLARFAENSQILSDELGPDNIHFYVDQNPAYIGFYWDRKNINSNFTSIYNKNISPIDLRKWVAEQQEPFLAAGIFPQEYYNIIEEKYPFLIYRDIGVGYEYYGYSKEAVPGMISNIVYSKTHDLGTEYNILDSLTEWGPGMSISIKEMDLDIYSLIDISVNARSLGAADNILLCCHIKNAEREVWMSTPIGRYIDENLPDRQKAYLSFRLIHHIEDIKEIADGEMNIFLWNKGAQRVALDDIKVEVRQGNPYIYALTSEFKKP